MPSAAMFRDSTQIVLPSSDMAEIAEIVESRFTVTVVREGDAYRIIGSPVEIKAVGDFLSYRGINLP